MCAGKTGTYAAVVIREYLIGLRPLRFRKKLKVSVILKLEGRSGKEMG